MSLSPGSVSILPILRGMAWPLLIGSADTKQIATMSCVQLESDREKREGKITTTKLLVQGCQTPKCRITTVVYLMLYVSGSRWGAGAWWWWWSEDRSSPAAGVAESAILLP